MLRLIGVLIMPTELGVTVETGAGHAEATFPNSAEGAQALIAFAEQQIDPAPDGVRIVVGSVSDDCDESHIADAFSKLELTHGFVMPTEVHAAVTEHGLPGPSAKAVLLADEKRFGFIYRKKH